MTSITTDPAKAYALVIGVSAVNRTAYNGWTGKNPTCKNDAIAMEAFAREKGFAVLGDGPLLNQFATREAVEATVKEAATELNGSGGILFVYFSGHGANKPRPGDAEIGEYWSLYDGPLWDYEWNELLRSFTADVRVLVVSDSCFAGGFGPPELADEDRKSPRVSPELLTECGFSADNRRRVPARVRKHVSTRQRPALGNGGSGEALEIPATVLLLAACQEDQDAYSGETNGVFTERLLKSVAANGDLTYNALNSELQGQFCRLQTPRLWSNRSLKEGFGEQKAFSIEPLGVPVG